VTLVDTNLGPLESAAADAAAAEAAGYAGAFTGEVNSDPFLPLALGAASTERIQLGTSIAVAFARSPMALAYTAYDLQRFSGGRFMLGLGSQVKAHVARRYSMQWGRPAVQMRDFVLAMQAIWQSWSQGSPLDFESEHYTHTLMTPTFIPPAHEFGAPAVFVAGVGDAMTRVAGEVADGFLCHGFTTERWIRERTLPALEEGRRRAGKTMDGFTIKAAMFLATGTDEQTEAAVAAIRSQLAFYASTPAYKSILELHGWGDLRPELTALSKQGQWKQMSGLIDDEMLAAFAVIAPPDEAPALVAKRCAGAIDRVSFIYSKPRENLVAALRDV
jgi:probable F420-dependent oxidoreductase